MLNAVTGYEIIEYIALKLQEGYTPTQIVYDFNWENRWGIDYLQVVSNYFDTNVTFLIHNQIVVIIPYNNKPNLDQL